MESHRLYVLFACYSWRVSWNIFGFLRHCPLNITGGIDMDLDGDWDETVRDSTAFCEHNLKFFLSIESPRLVEACCDCNNR